MLLPGGLQRNQPPTELSCEMLIMFYFFFNLNDVLSIFLHRCSDSSFIFSFKSSRHFAKSYLAAFLSRQSFNCVGTQSLHSEESTASFDKKENIGKHSKKNLVNHKF